MEEYLPPSQNGFTSLANAESALQRVLLNVCRDYLQGSKETGLLSEEKRTELEVEYLALEIAYDR